MASLQERRNKKGTLVSYSIRVHRGRDQTGKQLKPFTATFEVKPTWTERTARKKAEAFAATFEKECLQGITSDTRMNFAEYSDYVIGLKEQRGCKHSTVVRYRELTRRIYPVIGNTKLRELRADQLNTLYTTLSQSSITGTEDKVSAVVDLPALLKEKGLTRAELAQSAGININSVYVAVKGKRVAKKTADAIAKALGCRTGDLFNTGELRTLSVKTVLEHHRLIHTVLEQAVREGLIPYNVADRVELPKAVHKEVNYFQLEEIEAIRDALESEPIKWKCLTHLFLITGARRGEVLGLKWGRVDFTGQKIHICNTIQYTSDRGVYEETPKTARSDRYISLPKETMQLLRQYKAWQSGERLKLGEYYQDRGFLFTQEDGSPMHPDTVNIWLRKFSRRHNLPHINPHAFRHSMASLLYFNGMDSVSISHRLGHAQVSTTANIYAHIMEEADQKNADVLADIFLRKA